MSWILEHLQILIGVAAAIAYFINRRKRSEAEADAPPPRSATNHRESSYEQTERTRRVQDEIRRKIAERRGAGPGVPAVPASKSRIPDLVPPPRIPPLDPFGGPMRRILRKIEEAAEQATASPSAQESSTAANELARQRMLEERMREMEATKLVRENQLRTQAAMLAKKRSGLKESSAPLTTGRLGRALRSPQELRRAIVLREVLGPPVSLR